MGSLIRATNTATTKITTPKPVLSDIQWYFGIEFMDMKPCIWYPKVLQWPTYQKQTSLKKQTQRQM